MRMDSGHSSAGSPGQRHARVRFSARFSGRRPPITAIGDLPFIFLFIAVDLADRRTRSPTCPMADRAVGDHDQSCWCRFPLHAVTKATRCSEATQKNSHLFEVLHGIETIKAIRAEAWAERKWESAGRPDRRSRAMKMKMLSQISLHTMTMAAQLLTTVGIVRGRRARCIQAGDMSSGRADRLRAVEQRGSCRRWPRWPAFWFAGSRRKHGAFERPASA